MSKSRISDVGRRMITSNDDKELLFSQKPGYTWGMSTRTGPKDVSNAFEKKLIILISCFVFICI